MATQAERLEALEKAVLEDAKSIAELKASVATLTEKLSDVERILKDGETLEELRGLVAKAAPLSDFEALTEKVDQLAKDADAREDFSLMGEDGEPITAELVEGPDIRGDLLKAFRQIETIANHINVKLPS